MRSVGAAAALHLASAALVAAAEGGRPRGVAPEFAKFYKDDNTFTCISAPSVTLPVSRVNDDYCDCPDGSDEPGTAACAHLSSYSPRTPAGVAHAGNLPNISLALPGFYCKNKGHVPAYVPFTSVNDGICDYDLCCDGTEEWEGIGGVKCEDRCKEIGKEWKKQDEIRQKSLGKATQRRKELVKEAQKLRLQVQERMQTLQTQIEGDRIKVKNLEDELVEVEKQEKGKIVRDAGRKGGALAALIVAGKQRTEELRSSLERVRGERDDATGRLTELEAILSAFKEEYNPNFNDEGVKRAVRAWEDYAARDKGAGPDAAYNRDLDEFVKSDRENGLDWDSYDSQEEESDTDVLYAFEKYLPPSLRAFIDQKLRELRIMLIENGILAQPSGSGESQAIVDARNRLEAARRDLSNNENDLRGREEDLAKDFGPDDVFRALQGQCVSKESGEYTYEVCFMDKTWQKPKKGGGNTNMGNFVRLETIVVDDALPADGKGVGAGERIAMKHENGQHCWNGPNRSTTVILACAEENELWKVMEDEKCVYRIEMGTPAVCHANGSGRPAPSSKDEL